jgi:hypothetical protein
MRAIAPAALALAISLAACSKHPGPGDGMSVHQTVAISGAGTPDERLLEVLEDARITVPMRDLMWGGSKDPAGLIEQIGGGPALAKSLLENGFRHAVLRLTDRQGKVIADRRLDCELAEIAEPALPQGGHLVWGVGDDCSTGEGDFAGLVTRFLVPEPDRIRFETCHDQGSTDTLELTLVTARKIRWHLEPRDQAVLVHEVSSHPDFDDPAFKAMKPGDPPPPGLQSVVDYLTYRWDEPSGGWLRTLRTERDASWDVDAGWPADPKFPGG